MITAIDLFIGPKQGEGTRDDAIALVYALEQRELLKWPGAICLGKAQIELISVVPGLSLTGDLVRDAGTLERALKASGSADFAAAFRGAAPSGGPIPLGHQYNVGVFWQQQSHELPVEGGTVGPFSCYLQVSGEGAPHPSKLADTALWEAAWAVFGELEVGAMTAG
ncbi:MAG: hypothetical protein JRH20_32435 [Deltaproteobacteria bacterium]|nr:hypothetical protein [Deltaproteobacteria bacterium]